jgi:hypothetical protein
MVETDSIEEEFGNPHSDGSTLLEGENFSIAEVVPEFKISEEDRADLLVTALEHNNTRPFLLIECKVRAVSRLGPSYANAFLQAARYAKALLLQHFAVFDGWILILGKSSYPYVLGIYDAKIPEALTPAFMRELLHGIRKFESENKTDELQTLQAHSSPRDTEMISSQVLKPMARRIMWKEKGSEPDTTQVEILVKNWRNMLQFP